MVRFPFLLHLLVILSAVTGLSYFKYIDPPQAQTSPNLQLTLSRYTIARDSFIKATDSYEEARKTWFQAADTMMDRESDIMLQAADTALSRFFTSGSEQAKKERRDLEKEYPSRKISDVSIAGYTQPLYLFSNSPEFKEFDKVMLPGAIMVMPIGKFDKPGAPKTDFSPADLHKNPHDIVGWLVVRKYLTRWVIVAKLWDPNPRTLQLKLSIPIVVIDGKASVLPSFDIWESKEWRDFFGCNADKTSTLFCPLNIIVPKGAAPLNREPLPTKGS